MTAAEHTQDHAPPRRRDDTPGASALYLLVSIVALLVLARIHLAPHVTHAGLQAWSTIFVAICVQALPFLVFGVLLSAAIATFVPAETWTRLLPRRAAAAVPVAGAAGAVLPGCECASVPVAGSLMARGVAPAAALTFLLAAPAINPIVLVATAVAFPRQPEMVAARFGASLAVAVLVGWIWAWFGKGAWIRIPERPDHDGSKWEAFRQAMRHDLMHAGGFLVVGGAAAATINTVVPPSWLTGLGGIGWASVLTLAFLAVLMSLCSEADAFVAASLTAFSPTAKLTFLVVGPMVDLKLIAMQTGIFGRAFVMRFVPLTFVLAVAVSALVGGLFL